MSSTSIACASQPADSGRVSGAGLTCHSGCPATSWVCSPLLITSACSRCRGICCSAYAGEVNFGPSFLIGVGAYAAGSARTTSRTGRSGPAWLQVRFGQRGGRALLLAGAGSAPHRPVFRPGDAGRRPAPAKPHRDLSQAPPAARSAWTCRTCCPSTTSNNYWIALAFMSDLRRHPLSACRDPPWASSCRQAARTPSRPPPSASTSPNTSSPRSASRALFSGLAGAMLIFYEGTASPGTVVYHRRRRAGHRGRRARCGSRTILGAALGAIFLIVAERDFSAPSARLSTLRGLRGGPRW